MSNGDWEIDGALSTGIAGRPTDAKAQACADFEVQALAEVERVKRHGYGEVLLIIADGRIVEVRPTPYLRADRARKG